MAGLGGSVDIDPKTGEPKAWNAQHSGWSKGASGIGSSSAPRAPVGPGAPSSKPIGSTPIGGADYGTILKQFGQGGGGGASVAINNTSQQNPDVGWAQGQLKGLYESDGNTANLSRQTAGAIRDDAESLRKASRQNAASRGISGGGIEALNESSIDRSVLSDQAKARTGIANDWEARKQGILRDVAGNAFGDDSSQRADRALNLNQQQAGWQQAQAARDSEFRNIKNVIDLFGAIDKIGGDGVGNPQDLTYGAGYDRVGNPGGGLF